MAPQDAAAAAAARAGVLSRKHGLNLSSSRIHRRGGKVKQTHKRAIMLVTSILYRYIINYFRLIFLNRSQLGAANRQGFKRSQGGDGWNEHASKLNSSRTRPSRRAVRPPCRSVVQL